MKQLPHRDLALISVICMALTGCASTYGNLVSGNNLGAQEYMPAVYVKPGKEDIYSGVLPICRRVAINRQITASEEAQLRTITGVVSGSANGLATGMQFGSILKSAGISGHGQVTRAVGVGLATGLISSLADSFASGSENAADETKRILLNCLRTASNGNWSVLE